MYQRLFPLIILMNQSLPLTITVVGLRLVPDATCSGDRQVGLRLVPEIVKSIFGTWIMKGNGYLGIINITTVHYEGVSGLSWSHPEFGQLLVSTGHDGVANCLGGTNRGIHNCQSNR
jgi:hypothetical protein